MTQPETKTTLSPISFFFVSHLRAFWSSLQFFFRHFGSTLLILLIIGVVFALPGNIFLFLKHFKALSQVLGKEPQIFLYLKTPTPALKIDTFQHVLKSRADIEKVDYISPKQGLIEFKKNTGLESIFEDLPHNPLPPVFIVTPSKATQSLEAIKHLFTTLKQMPLVELAQLDIHTITQFYYWSELIKKISYVFIVIIDLGLVLFLIYVLKQVLESKKMEHRLLKQMGATQHFIKRPFLYQGVLYGIGGGVVAYVFAMVTLYFIEPYAAQLAKIYGQSFVVSADIKEFFGFVLLPGIVVWTVAWWINFIYYFRK